MEGGVAKIELPDTPKKPGSLDHKSFHRERSIPFPKSRVANQSSVLKRINGTSLDSRGPGFTEPRKKQSRKEGSSTSPYHATKRRRRGPPQSESNGFVSGVGKRDNQSLRDSASRDLSGQSVNSHDQVGILALLPAKKRREQASNFDIPESLDGVHDTSFPKLPRGISRRKRAKSSITPKRASGTSVCNSETAVDVKNCKFPVNNVPPSQASLCKKNKVFDESKEIDSSRTRSNHSRIRGNGTSVQASSKKVRNKKLPVSNTETQIYREVENHMVEDDRSSGEYFLDYDDEENLEQNAARMLSSRFDPSCIGFTGKRETYSMPANESSLQRVHQFFEGSTPEVSSVQAEGRSLRPRNKNGKGFARKRRHFYEVCYSDMDPQWVVRQRIRVFWPLDQSWYFGLVKDYDPVRKLHYVKYDDRDEEWIDLQNERFKLLLFPSEVKFNAEKCRSRVRKRSREGDIAAVDANCAGSITESETIISWLTRSNRPVKSFPVSVQKQRSTLLEEFEPLFSTSGRLLSARSSGIISNKLSSCCIAPERLGEGDITRVPQMESRTDSGNKKISFVYFRKRFRQREGFCNSEGDATCVSSTGPISLLASVADRESALEELFFNVMPMKLMEITLKLRLPRQNIHHHASGAEFFLLYRALLFHQGKLMQLWPMIDMEIAIVDKALGLKVLSFECCLRRAVSLVCLIMAIFYRNGMCSKLSGVEAPFTSIGFKLSGLHGQQEHFLFTLCSFMELKSSKWRYLESRLKQHCKITKELSAEDCTDSNIKTLSSGSNQILFPPLFEYLVSSEVAPENSCSDIMHQLIIKNLACYYPEFCQFQYLPPSTISFAAAPSIFLSMHLKLLVDKNKAALGFKPPNSATSQNCTGSFSQLTTKGCSAIEEYSDQVSEITNENFGSAAVSSGQLSSQHLKVETDALSASNDGDWARSNYSFLNGKVENPVGHYDSKNKASDGTFIQSKRFPCCETSPQDADKSSSTLHEDSPCSGKCEARYNSHLNDTEIRSQLHSPVEKRLSERGVGAQKTAQFSTNLVLGMKEPVIRSPRTTGPRSIWRRNRHSPVSPTFGQFSKLWPEDFIQKGFVNASRKPRTHVSYFSPAVDCDLGSKSRNHHRKERCYKKILRTGNAKKTSSSLENPENLLRSSTCCANVLITVGDKGWRECGAQVVLDSDDQKNWRILVKFSGTTKFMYKAHQFLQPGTTNRYTHAMMWKGGRDWTLEFTDRSQWSLFKVMYEECFNRNIHSASVKNIPIPGVRLIDEGDENVAEMPFIWNSSKYHCQIETDIDMALNPCHVLYDMDSGDEEWLSSLKNSSDYELCKNAEVSDDMFESVMDMFEKLAYVKQCDRFTSDDIEEFMTDFGSSDVIKAIYEHWKRKREKKGLPLIRHFQPALWEHYQKQLKEWELAMSKMHTSSDGYQQKAHSIEKPPMFAFCLRPRGLEVPNKCSKQKSHKKFMFTGHHNSFIRGQDSLHAFGRKSNGISVGHEVVSPVSDHEYCDSSHWLQYSSSTSFKDAPRTRNNSKKKGMSLSPKDSKMLPFIYYEKSKKNGELLGRNKQSQSDRFHRCHADNEFRLRDASSAAQHALNMAKLKREKAQWLLHKADAALHKAMVSVMTAEAIKASHKELIGDG